MFRFIHSSDLHLGKRFGNFTGDVPSRLREARHAVLACLAQHARDHNATTILLAGDTFDTETPAADVRRQALAEMADHKEIQWVILPGNHDSLQAIQLWSTLTAEAPKNVILAVEPRPITLQTDVVLLPAPCTTRRPGRDLTEWMDSEVTAEGAIRIGLAHGAIQNFSEESGASDVIAPDRARRANLDYLALGDWHGTIEVDARTRYCGAPEPDRFKHDRPGTALLVTIASASAIPEITPLETARFAWRTLELHLLESDDALPALEGLLPEMRSRRQTLIRLLVTGRSHLAKRAALSEAVNQAKPDFAFLEMDDGDVATEYAVGDLDLIDRAGALREAADSLLADSKNESHSAAEREIARAALARLYSYAQMVTS